MEHTYDEADYISLHQYYGYHPEYDKEVDFLHSYMNLDSFISTITATADYVKAYKRSKKTMMLALDEWNIWHMHIPNPPGVEWAIAPELIENRYSVRDALTLSGLMMTMINHADRIKIGCLAQLVNVIAPILTKPNGEVIKQTIFYPYQAGCLYAKGNALHTETVAPKIETKHGDAKSIYSAATYQEETGELTLFLLNTGETALHTELRLGEFDNLVWKEHQRFTGELTAVNTFEQPENAVMVTKQMEKVYEKDMPVALPGYSFHVLRFVENGKK